jgi:hypothetical protein
MVWKSKEFFYLYILTNRGFEVYTFYIHSFIIILTWFGSTFPIAQIQKKQIHPKEWWIHAKLN